ncbi:hypothetical protein MAH_1612 [Mycobacterium numidiamassiliense]|uniref:Uncharacterized protein n=1 Tax=Mycobacterium numidiamassiliense TaxID=1841861 RepID=A0A2U3PA07_9MYCO|nr:hypothetical protein MAH_1612 [Mycobacterium numidiamassiliense]
MMQINTVVAAARTDAIGNMESEILYLDPDIAALFAEVDDILRAALDAAHCPPAPLVTGCVRMGPPAAGRSWCAIVRPRGGPVHPVRAVQRSPPTQNDPRPRSTNPSERQVMASRQT